MDLQARRERERAKFDGVYCSLEIAWPASHVVVVTIRGSDVGEFADAPFRELTSCIEEAREVDLFIDSRDTRGASIAVSSDWAIWLERHRASLRRVTMLTGSRFIEITADFVRRFAMLEDVMRVVTDPAEFDAALAQAVRAGR